MMEQKAAMTPYSYSYYLLSFVPPPRLFIRPHVLELEEGEILRKTTCRKEKCCGEPLDSCATEAKFRLL